MFWVVLIGRAELACCMALPRCQGARRKPGRPWILGCQAGCYIDTNMQMKVRMCTLISSRFIVVRATKTILFGFFELRCLWMRASNKAEMHINLDLDLRSLKPAVLSQN